MARRSKKGKSSSRASATIAIVLVIGVFWVVAQMSQFKQSLPQIAAARTNSAVKTTEAPEQAFTVAPMVVEATTAPEPVLPKWVTGWPADFKLAMDKESQGLTDKTNDVHQFHKAYQPNLSRLVRRKLHVGGTNGNRPKIRFLEIGLGCSPDGGMIQGKPGGSALAWRAMFDQIPGLEFDLHVMEYDAVCAKKWAAEHAGIAQVHSGDQSSEVDLMRVLQESGGEGFDVIIDDGSHINWHQIETLNIMYPHVKPGGMYFIEDIWSACSDWSANMGTHRGADVGGQANCMDTGPANGNKPTILAHLMEWQRYLVGRHEYAKHTGKTTPVESGNAHIEIYFYMAVVSKEDHDVV